MATTTPGSYGDASHTGAVAPRRTVRTTFTETKLGIKTSEFWMMIVFIAGVLIAAYAKNSDALSRDDGWKYASFAAVAYIISRGFAKAGVREPYNDDDRDY
jgi:hypothetical protein